MAREIKNPILAALLSFIFPGLGQLYCGRILRALFFLALPFLIVILATTIFFTFILGASQLEEGSNAQSAAAATGLITSVLLYVVGPLLGSAWGCYDAYSCAEAINRGSSRGGARRRRGGGSPRKRSRRRSEEGRPEPAAPSPPKPRRTRPGPKRRLVSDGEAPREGRQFRG